MEQDTNNNNEPNNKQNLSDTDLFKFLNKYKIFILIIGAIALLGSDIYYTIDANERGVVLRFGKYHTLVDPGLHFKIPFIDKVEKVKVDFIYKEEFGYKTVDADVKSEYAKDKSFEEVSWMLTTETSGDQSIAEVTWVVQYRIDDPVKYLYKVKNVKNTIRDVSEAAMRLAVGDKTFDEVIGDKRVEIGFEAQERMREILESYNSGVYVQTVKLMSVKPPANVADSFNRVVQAEQDKEVSQNVARKDSTNTINFAIGDRDRRISEAEGYRVEQINMAQGDVSRFLAILKEYEQDPTTSTKMRMYYDKVTSVLSNAGEVTVFDSSIQTLSPLFNIDNINPKKND